VAFDRHATGGLERVNFAGYRVGADYTLVRRAPLARLAPAA
jgi:hypothetical protein